MTLRLRFFRAPVCKAKVKLANSNISLSSVKNNLYSYHYHFNFLRATYLLTQEGHIFFFLCLATNTISYFRQENEK